MDTILSQIIAASTCREVEQIENKYILQLPKEQRWKLTNFALHKRMRLAREANERIEKTRLIAEKYCNN